MGKILFLGLILASTAFAGGIEESFKNVGYPIHPNHTRTPGSLCTEPDSFRYPEGIPYCDRDVSTNTKNNVIDTYEKDGFAILIYDRINFKVDHLIPLCMGGSNEKDNLWPQYKDIYAITDQLEQESCVKMAEGKLKQKDAVILILKAKNNLDKANAILKKIQSL